MRILHMLAFFRAEYGGPVRAVLDLGGALAARGHEVTLCSWDDADVPAAWRAGTDPKAPRIVTIAPPTGTGSRFTGAAREELKQLIASHDLLHLHGVWNPWNWQLGALARSIGKPYIISVRGMLDDWCMEQKALKKKMFLAFAVRRWLERAAFVHLTAQAEHDQARKHFPRGRGIVISNLTDLTPFESLPGPELIRAKHPWLDPKRPTLLFLSRIHVKKGLEVLLSAASLLHQRGIPVRIAIAGTGDTAYVDTLKRLTAGLGLGHDAHFMGLVVDQEKLSLYQAADLFVLPTSQENFGFVFIEALACGTPVVTTKGVDIWPELQASGGAVIADPTPEAFADAIAGLLADRASLPSKGRQGRDWVFKALHPDHVVSQFEAMYTEAISTK